MSETISDRIEPLQDVHAGHEGGRSVRRYLEISWVTTIVLFTIGRLVVAQSTLAEYGLNIWVFGIIDLATAVPYAIGVAKVVEGMVDRKPTAASWWAAVAGVSFIAPYLYIFWAGKDVEFPRVVYYVLGALILIFGANAVRTVRRKVRQGRTEG